MNKKGFTLIELLGTLVIISMISLGVFSVMNSTLSISKEEAYKIMKNNIISTGKDYITECEAKTIECDISLTNNTTSKIPVGKLKEMGFIKNLKSPIDGKNLANCLILEAKKENGVTIINLIDNCY